MFTQMVNSNKLVLIIGGTSGIGLETAKYLKNQNYNVIVSGRRKLNNKDLITINADIQSIQSVKQLFTKVVTNYGQINALVFSAGITIPQKSIEDFDEKIFQEVIDTNVTGLLRLLKYFFPSLKTTKGKVAVINSVAARTYSKFSGLEYTISKGALSSLVKQLAVDWAKDGVFINSVFPSMTLTPMLKQNVNDEKLKKVSESLLLNRLAEPLDTARAIEFLISKENKYITGSGIDISGGEYLNG